MTEEEYASYRADAESAYARDIHSSGTLSEARAREKARSDYARLLPQGLATPGSHLWTAYVESTPVGMLWVAVTEGPEESTAFVYDVQVRPEHRRRGYGRAVMQAAEDFCLERGVSTLRLNVFGDNEAARALYEQLGFATTSVQMAKTVRLHRTGGHSG